jgi:tetratricopeptide (TPR) repeat protein
VTRHAQLSFAIGCFSTLLFISGHAAGQANISRAAEVKTYMEQGQRALRENQTQAAAEAYRSILKIDPANVEARANLGVVDMVTGDWAQASEELNRALKLNPGQRKVQALLGLCEVHLGRRSEAAKLLSASFAQLDDPKLRHQAGLELLELWYQGGDLNKANVVLGQLQHFYPTDAAVSYAAYRVYSDLAFQAVRSLALNAPDSALLHTALAEHMVNEGHAPEAIAEYQKALATTPNAPSLHYELGEAILANSHLEASLAEAQKEFEAALLLNPTDARSECNLGKIEQWRSNSTTASNHYERALKLNPEIVCAQLGLAGLLEEEGKTEQVLGYLKSAARADPYNAEVHHRLAVLYRTMGQTQEADHEMSTFQELKSVEDQLQKVLQPELPSN